MGSCHTAFLSSKGCLDLGLNTPLLRQFSKFRRARFFRNLAKPTAYLFCLLAWISFVPTALFGARVPAAPPVLTNPVPGGLLPGSTMTFAWTAGTDVSEYLLHVNTA